MAVVVVVMTSCNLNNLYLNFPINLSANLSVPKFVMWIGHILSPKLSMSRSMFNNSFLFHSHTHKYFYLSCPFMCLHGTGTEDLDAEAITIAMVVVVVVVMAMAKAKVAAAIESQYDELVYSEGWAFTLHKNL